MESEIISKDKKNLIISWSKVGVGFGQLTFKYDEKIRDFLVDSECMDIDHILEVFKALK